MLHGFFWDSGEGAVKLTENRVTAPGRPTGVIDKKPHTFKSYLVLRSNALCGALEGKREKQFKSSGGVAQARKNCRDSHGLESLSEQQEKAKKLKSTKSKLQNLKRLKGGGKKKPNRDGGQLSADRRCRHFQHYYGGCLRGNRAFRLKNSIWVVEPKGSGTFISGERKEGNVGNWERRIRGQPS